MHREYLLINDCRNWQTVEAIGESFPKLDIVAPLAFVVETIYTVDRSTFVVASQDKKVFGILDLVCQKEADGLKGLLPSVHVIAEEQVVRLRRKSPIFKETEKIVILAMNVTTYL